MQNRGGQAHRSRPGLGDHAVLRGNYGNAFDCAREGSFLVPPGLGRRACAGSGTASRGLGGTLFEKETGEITALSYICGGRLSGVPSLLNQELTRGKRNPFSAALFRRKGQVVFKGAIYLNFGTQT